MPLFEMTREDLVECKPVTFTHLEIKERAGLQHVLRDHIEVLGEDLRLIAEEYGGPSPAGTWSFWPFAMRRWSQR